MDWVKNKERIKTLIYIKISTKKTQKSNICEAKRSKKKLATLLRSKRTWLKRLCTKGRQDYNNQEIEKQSRRIEARHKNKGRTKKTLHSTEQNRITTK